ncbi:hypothetical protein ALP10_200004 [Pseudomonas syringae pv. helianthi]|uniref:Uncharacterized protein n=1 Tax=Pseudomonas syringae pv. helianthi TaxID=251654 RepID=A0A3M6DBE0_9PSED|nr:hypothetical protein ALP10_200004 [Pseudomonas syringae pv. helianthi]
MDLIRGVYHPNSSKSARVHVSRRHLAKADTDQFAAAGCLLGFCPVHRRKSGPNPANPTRLNDLLIGLHAKNMCMAQARPGGFVTIL